MEKNPLNVYGKPLIACCYEPLTGYFRDGFCKTIDADTGTHVVCAQVTEEFLNFSANRGNDLITPRPQWNFPGLKPGDFWCLCVSRWLEAEKAGVAPKLKLEACHQETLNYTRLELLEQYALPE
ncbi:DUF2237 family protein [Leeuwenhoekiella parthenopeia]|uniref:DUF2237 domain-containing protein n=1 Tax=Leeuwenhoekiella parthenopeia TaxID=2890320 RepID=A0ABS8GTC0_9FLAO|nr:DUF2237 domain-containing protein [Leeuwenhoekiella parthenopeia]MCC4213003.1 DUF2237 domain-containing protein [Leeuwenhoekiella parthenopeia]